jgi:hypothetical protein
MQNLLFSNKDLLASYLRTQISKLNKLLEDLENEDANGAYFNEHLKKVEKNIQKLRRVIW